MTELLRQAQLIAAKDLKLFMKDRFAVVFALGFPLLFVVAFSLLLGDVGPEDQRLSITIVTKEGPQGASHQIIGALNTRASVDLRVADEAEARQAMDDGELNGYLIFPADFTSRLAAGEPAEVKVIANADAQNTQAALFGVARAIAVRVTYAAVTFQAIDEIPGADPNVVFDEDAFASEEPIGLAIERVGDIRSFNPNNFTLPGYLTMFVFFAAALGAEAIAKERAQQTLERLASNGMRRGSLILGKFLGACYKGLLQITLLWVFGLFVFNINFGVSPAAVVLVSLVIVLTSAAFGVMLAALVNTERAGGSAAVLASLTLAPLGGSWWPLFVTPQWMQDLAKLTPHGWANTAFNKLMLFGATFSDVFAELVALAIFGALFYATALWRFRVSSAE